VKTLFALLLLALAWDASGVSPEIRYFRYQRPVENLPSAANQACLVIDPAIFAHAAPQLADLRLYRAATETPYVVHLAEPIANSDQQVALSNLGQRGGQTVFDAAMPVGSYRDIELAIAKQDFIATVTVTGSQAQTAAAETKLGSFTIFDLTRQKLGRSTVLHLPRSDFRFLHFRIAGPISPDNVTGLTILRLAASAPRYITVAASSQVTQKGRESVIEFAVPARTPVDRVTFAPGAQPANFSRDVSIRVVPAAPPKTDSGESAQPVESTGNLLRLHRVEQGHLINEEHLSVDAPQGIADGATRWSVIVENGDDAPLALNSVRLEMMERDLCFDAAPPAAYTLYYGDSALSAPQYDYAALFAPQKDAAQATAGPESPNPAYQPRPDTRPFTERHPSLLWAALGAVIVLLGLIALRSAKSSAPAPH